MRLFGASRETAINRNGVLSGFSGKTGRADGADAIGNDFDGTHSVTFEDVTGAFARRPKRDFTIEPVRPSLLPAADGRDRPRIKCAPNRPEDFVDVGDVVRPAPPRRVPRKAVMLVHHQVELRLFPIPTVDRFEDRTAHPARRQGTVRMPSMVSPRAGSRRKSAFAYQKTSLTTLSRESPRQGLRDPFRTSGKGVFRVAPIEHHESHRQSVNNPLFPKRIFRQSKPKPTGFLKLCFRCPMAKSAPLSAGKLLPFSCRSESIRRY